MVGRQDPDVEVRVLRLEVGRRHLVHQIVREKNRLMINSGAGASEITGALCSPNTIHYWRTMPAPTSGLF
jgi:hypothetical protein